jgi:hypothetical protein
MRVTDRAFLSAALALSACGGGGSNDPPATTQPPPQTPATTVPLSPAAPVVIAGATLQLSPPSSWGNAPVVWRVDDVPGGNASVGTISTAGVYRAPTFVPMANPVKVSAVRSGGSEIAAADVTVSPAGLTLEWQTWQPRVMNASVSENVTLIVRRTSDVTSVVFQPTSGTPTTLANAGNGIFQLTTQSSGLLSGYTTGDLHRLIGFLDSFVGSTRRERINLSVNVRDASVPDVVVTPVSATAQRSPHVLNLILDSLFTGGGNSAPLTAVRNALAIIGDNTEFVAVIQQVSSTNNRNFVGVRNTTQGIGLPRFDNGAAFGSAARLEGVINYPIDGFFDLGERAGIHELGHRWINFSRHSALSTGRPHWPISDIASGIMGFSIPPSGQGGNFDYTLTPAGGGDYRLTASTAVPSFNNLELYFMGLAPASEVGSWVVFTNQSQLDQLRDGGILRGPTTMLTVDQLVASDGERIPAYGAAPTAFREVTIVLSTARLLTAQEMAFFDHMAARGEARTPLRFVSGFSSGMSNPFFVATKGRGQLITRLP